MKSIILITLIFSLNHALAQPLSKPLQAMVDAERQFARISKETNTVNAFISSLSPTALFMIQGEEVNGLESWKKREADESLLFWEPEFADIASSEDFGYTTGPFAYYSNRSDTVAAFRGYYSSIWGKELNGEWKVLFDLGSSVSTKGSSLVTTSSKKLIAPKKQNKEAGLKELLALDKRYAEKLNASTKSFDPAYFSSEGRLHRPRQLPSIGLEKVRLVDEGTNKYAFTPLNGKITSSCDMGYTYGKVKVTINQNGNERVLDLSSFRIWKKEDGSSWKIVLDVIGQ